MSFWRSFLAGFGSILDLWPSVDYGVSQYFDEAGRYLKKASDDFPGV